MADAAPAPHHATPEQLQKWGMMEAEEQGLCEKLESSVSTLTSAERSAMTQRHTELSAKRESRNKRYFSQAKAQDLGNLLKDLKLLHYLYVVCNAYGDVQQLLDEVESRGADWVATDLMALPMTEEHAWVLLGAGLGIKGGPGQGGKGGKGGRGAGDGDGAGESGRRGRRGSGGSDDSSRRRGGRNGEGEDGSGRDGRHGQGRDGCGDGDGDADGDGGHKRGHLSHAERVRRFLAQHDDLVELERLQKEAEQRRRNKQKKRRRSKRAEERYAIAEADEVGWGEGRPHPLLDATCKLWTARLDGVGVSVRGRTRCNRSVSLPMNSSLNREEWMGETMRFLQERSLTEGGIGGPAVGMLLEDDEVYYGVAGGETEEQRLCERWRRRSARMG